MSKALKFLLKNEWTMGNGQCDECCGGHKGWHDHPCYRGYEGTGHSYNCGIGLAIRELGGETHFIGELDNEGNRRYTLGVDKFNFIKGNYAEDCYCHDLNHEIFNNKNIEYLRYEPIENYANILKEIIVSKEYAINNSFDDGLVYFRFNEKVKG